MNTQFREFSSLSGQGDRDLEMVFGEARSAISEIMDYRYPSRVEASKDMVEGITLILKDLLVRSETSFRACQYNFRVLCNEYPELRQIMPVSANLVFKVDEME